MPPCPALDFPAVLSKRHRYFVFLALNKSQSADVLEMVDGFSTRDSSDRRLPTPLAVVGSAEEAVQAAAVGLAIVCAADPSNLSSSSMNRTMTTLSTLISFPQIGSPG